MTTSGERAAVWVADDHRSAAEAIGEIAAGLGFPARTFATAEPSYDGCDNWADWTFAARVGYKLTVVPEKLGIVANSPRPFTPAPDCP